MDLRLISLCIGIRAFLNYITLKDVSMSIEGNPSALLFKKKNRIMWYQPFYILQNPLYDCLKLKGLF